MVSSSLIISYYYITIVIYLLADDTNISYEAKNLIQLQRVVKNKLKNVKIWFNVNQLLLNMLYN